MNPVVGLTPHLELGVTLGYQWLRPDAPAAEVSGITAFELGLKVRRQLIQLPLPPGAWVTEVCRRRNIGIVPIDVAIAGAAMELPRVHSDPCDRFLIATAQRNRLTLATPDANIRRYPDLNTLW